MNDYERVARIIAYLGDHYRDQPDLDHLAEVAGLSPSHFHRLFRRWAQTTPKNFVQHLTALEAGSLLRNGSSVLDTSLEVGLSGPSRLHDLCINLEAATPGEIRSGGEGWTIQAGFTETPFGEALVAQSPRGICKFSFVSSIEERDAEWTLLENAWPQATLHREDQVASCFSDSVFSEPGKNRGAEPLKLYVKGTAFQTRVWRALVEIPAGEVCSYGKIAEMVGNAKASRAVGAAVGRNPLAVVIPCHRAIHATGCVGNYHWGTARKKALLAFEQTHGSSA